MKCTDEVKQFASSFFVVRLRIASRRQQPPMKFLKNSIKPLAYGLCALSIGLALWSARPPSRTPLKILSTPEGAAAVNKEIKAAFQRFGTSEINSLYPVKKDFPIISSFGDCNIFSGSSGFPPHIRIRVGTPRQGYYFIFLFDPDNPPSELKVEPLSGGSFKTNDDVSRAWDSHLIRINANMYRTLISGRVEGLTKWDAK